MLGYSLISNHPFIDGNKRTGHAAIEVFLMLNGWEIRASVDEQERVILGVASGEIDSVAAAAKNDRYEDICNLQNELVATRRRSRIPGIDDWRLVIPTHTAGSG